MQDLNFHLKAKIPFEISFENPFYKRIEYTIPKETTKLISKLDFESVKDSPEKITVWITFYPKIKAKDFPAQIIPLGTYDKIELKNILLKTALELE